PLTAPRAIRGTIPRKSTWKRFCLSPPRDEIPSAESLSSHRANRIVLRRHKDELANNAGCTHVAFVLVTARSAQQAGKRMEGFRFSIWRVDMGRRRKARPGTGNIYLPA